MPLYVFVESSQATLNGSLEYHRSNLRHLLVFQDMWVGLLHHVTLMHQWVLGCCHHGLLEEPKKKDWIELNSLAHQKLTELILGGWPGGLKNINFEFY